MAYTISPATAKRALRLLESDTPEHAAHNLEVGLQAIEPYTDGRTEAVVTLLRKYSQLDESKREKWLAQIKVIAHERQEP